MSAGSNDVGTMLIPLTMWGVLVSAALLLGPYITTGLRDLHRVADALETLADHGTQPCTPDTEPTP